MSSLPRVPGTNDIDQSIYDHKKYGRKMIFLEMSNIRIFRAFANYFSLRQQYIFCETSLGKYIMYQTKHVASFTLTFIMTGQKQQLKSISVTSRWPEQIVCYISSRPSEHDRNGLGWCPSHKQGYVLKKKMRSNCFQTYRDKTLPRGWISGWHWDGCNLRLYKANLGF